MMAKTQTAAPTDIPQIKALLGNFDGRIAYIAGGTDLIIALEHQSAPDLIIDVSQIRELAYINIGEASIRIGAATHLSALSKHPALGAALPVLAQSAGQVGSVQIRNRATLGGNIASAMPAGDLLPALKCLDARVEILSRTGNLMIRGFDDVVIGSGKTTLNNGDLIAGVYIPMPSTYSPISAFEKIGRRTTLSIARLNLAAVVDYDRTQNHVRGIRLVAGAIGPVPVRLYTVEKQFHERIVDQSLVDDFLHALVAAIDAAIPGRYSQPYKRRAVLGLGLDLLHNLFGREFAAAPAVCAST